jgi:hypothetical protein
MAQKRARSRGVFTDKAVPQAEAEAEPRVAFRGEEVPGDEHLRVTTYLSVDQLDHLDRDRIMIRRSTRQVLERTAIIRGLVEGYRRSGVDLAALRIGTEAELVEFVAKRLERSGS